MKLFSALFAALFLFAFSPAHATDCNPPDSWIKSKGTYTIGDIVIFGPDCETISDGGPVQAGSFRNITGAASLTTADCNTELLLGGNTYYTVSVGTAASFGTCNLRIRNVDQYTGAGTGRGKKLSISGFSVFNLYPGQYINLQSNGTIWAPSQPIINNGYGYVWSAPGSVVQFFVDSGAPDDSQDGLAQGSSGSFKTLQHCASAAYSIVYSRNFGGVRCSVTAGSNLLEFVQVFYPLPGGGTLTFDSATPGVQWTWTCLGGSYCLQFGDNALVGVTDIRFLTNPSTIAVITGHNIGVLDVNTNVRFDTNVANNIFTCDFDTHFNINNGFTYSNASSIWFNGCQNSNWNINGAIVASGTVTVARPFNFAAGSKAAIQGNVSFTGTITASGAGLISGASVVNNASGAVPPGGAPTPTTGGQYCTTAC